MMRDDSQGARSATEAEVRDYVYGEAGRTAVARVYGDAGPAVMSRICKDLLDRSGRGDLTAATLADDDTMNELLVDLRLDGLCGGAGASGTA